MRAFSPYDSDDFTTEYANVNGHYDIQGSAFFIDGPIWVLRYESASDPGQIREGEPIEFISHNGGETFRVRARSNHPAEGS